jgi:hypothetical protein
MWSTAYEPGPPVAPERRGAAVGDRVTVALVVRLDLRERRNPIPRISRDQRPTAAFGGIWLHIGDQETERPRTAFTLVGGRSRWCGGSRVRTWVG